MSVESDQRPVGDPAFEGDPSITHEPVVEEERSELAHPERLRRPLTWAIVGAVVGLIALAVVAGATAGWGYAIPFALIAVLGIGFAALHRGAAEVNRRRPDDPLPDVTFDKRA